MTTIWKFPLKLIDEQTISVPADAKILSVQLQHDIPCIWALVNTDNPETMRSFLIAGTGDDLNAVRIGPDGPMIFLGTVQIHPSYPMEFHVFETTAENS